MIADELETLRASLAAIDGIDRATLDAASVKPSPGKVTAFIGAPTLTWDNWEGHETSTPVMIVAGTTSSAGEALRLLHKVIDLIEAGKTINITKATPDQWSRGDGGELAAYLLTIVQEG